MFLNPHRFGGPAEAAVTANPAVNTSNSTSYTFSSQSFGAAHGTRQVVVCASFEANSGGDTDIAISSMTIGGVSASSVATVRNSTELFHATEMWAAAVPSGTSGDVVITLNKTANHIAISVHRMINAATTANDTATDQTGDPLNTTIDCSADGVIIGAAAETGSKSFTWTNLDEDSDVNNSNLTHSSASKEFDSAQTGLSITADQSSNSRPRLVLASWDRR